MSDAPILVSGDSLQLSQSNFVRDMDTDINDGDSLTGVSNVSLSDGRGIGFNELNGWLETHPFTLDYHISEQDVGISGRFYQQNGDAVNTTELELKVVDADNNTEVGSLLFYNPDMFVVDDPLWYHSSGEIEEWTGGDIEPGTYYLRIDCIEFDVEVDVDIISFYDSRFTYTFDDQVHQDNGYLDGPELYPDLHEVQLETATTRRDVTEATINSSWSDVSNNQYIEIANDPGGEGYLRFDNSDTVDVQFAGPETGIDVRFGLSRYPSGTNPQDATPRYGYNGQVVDNYTLLANPDAITRDGTGQVNLRAIIQPGEITGSVLREVGQLADDNTLLTRSVMAEFEVSEQMRVISSETVSFGNP